jgi:hypothetical protein
VDSPDIIPVRPGSPYNSHFAAYGLGWRLTDVSGYLEASHTGGLSGVVTQVTLIPELKLGIIVFTNQQAGGAFSAISNTIKDSYLGVRGNDWVRRLSESTRRSQEGARKITDEVWAAIDAKRAMGTEAADPAPYAGTYTDNWLGDIIISDVGGHLRFRSVRSPRLRGDMLWYTANTFIVRWDDRSMDADAWAVFSLDREGRPSAMTMEAISPLTDFSYDFHDLSFRRKEDR